MVKDKGTKMFFEHLEKGNNEGAYLLNVKVFYSKINDTHKVKNIDNGKEMGIKKINTVGFIFRKYPIQTLLFFFFVIFYTISHFFMVIFLVAIYGMIIYKTNLLDKHYYVMEKGLGVIGAIYGIIMVINMLYYKFSTIDSYTSSLEGVTMGLFLAFFIQVSYGLYNKYKRVFKVLKKEEEGIGQVVGELYCWY